MTIILHVDLFVVYLTTRNESSYTHSNFRPITALRIKRDMKRDVVAKFDIMSRQFCSGTSGKPRVVLLSSPPANNPTTHRLKHNWHYTHTVDFMKCRISPEDGL
jgi:hypothetical protein